jgi:hypothetical protein
MVQKSNAAVSNKSAVMIDSHYTAIALKATMFCSWGHNFATRLTPSELADLRYLP